MGESQIVAEKKKKTEICILYFYEVLEYKTLICDDSNQNSNLLWMRVRTDFKGRHQVTGGGMNMFQAVIWMMVTLVGFPGGSIWVQSLGWEDPLENRMATHSGILAWRVHGQRSLAG